MKLIIDVPENTYKRIKGLVDADYFEHDINGFSQRAIANGTPIPDNATNEKAIRALFPYTIFVEDGIKNRIIISKEWWNAPYQKGGKE